MTIHNGLAPTPPMGWNSWDCFGPSVREDEVKANADYMAAYLLQHGWDTIVVDIQWSDPAARAHGYNSNATLVMDDYGRLLPALNRFPSAANGAGFKPLADFIHAKGLKFGIHILHGIPRIAVRQNLPILNSEYHAADIADTSSTSTWIDDMYGVDMSKAGAQAYYNSILELYASWDVDFIKCDDILWPYHADEIEGLHQAIEHSKRPITLSLSPGVEVSTDHYDHLRQNCELFRISADFWDRWEDLKVQFANCAKWSDFTGPGCWADADLLPLGHIGIRAERGDDRQSLLTHDEQTTLMTLWVISRSPLMFGGHLPDNDDFTLGLLTNGEVLKVLQTSSDNKQLFQHGGQIAWLANSSESDDQYLALFNIGDQTAMVETNLALIGQAARYEARDLWSKTDVGTIKGNFSQALAPHASKIFRLSPVS
ncbi:MAG: glycoside hydrolase family 27 protein [Anaerolineae bacterium]|nr:glycoside hydrolase family 27 protein [Anaerolineae bacterium]